MSVSTTITKVTYSGSGSAGPFPFIFPYVDSSDITVRLDGALQVEGSTYSLARSLVGAGGNITLSHSITSANTLEISREMALTQPYDFENNGVFSAEAQEAALDRIVLLCQQISNKSVKLPNGYIGDSVLPAPTPNGLLSWNHAGTALVSLLTAPAYVSTTVSASSYGGDIADAVTAIGGASVTLVIDSPITCLNNCTIPANILTIGKKPGDVNISSGKTLTINGPFKSGLFQIFSGSGAVNFNTQFGGTSLISQGIGETWAEWFGAVTNDSTESVGLANVVAITKAFNSAVTAGKVCFGAGIFYTSGSIAHSIFNGTVQGSGKYATTLQALHDADIIIQFNDAYNTTVKGMSFYSGATHLLFDTNNADAAHIVVSDCVLRQSVGSSILTSNNSNSTLLHIENCTMVTGTGTSTAVESYTDYTYVTNCWASLNGNTGFIAHQGEFSITGLVGVGATNPAECSWVTGAATVKLKDNRLSCDGGGARRVLDYDNTAVPSSVSNSKVIVEDCFIGQGGVPYLPDFKFTTLPNYTVFRNNRYSSSGGLVQVVDDSTGISSSRVGGIVNEGGFYGFYQTGSSVKGTASALMSMKGDVLTTGTYTVADVHLSRPLKDFLLQGTAPSNVTISAAAHPITGTSVFKAAATAHDASFNYLRNNDVALFYLTNGTYYTLVIDYFVTIGNAHVQQYANNNKTTRAISKGMNVICTTFYCDNTLNDPGINVVVSGITNSTEIYCSNIRIIVGRVDVNTLQLEMTDLVATTITEGAAVAFIPGDTVKHIDAAASGYIGRVRTATGWKTYGAISA